MSRVGTDFERLKARWREEASLQEREADLRRTALRERGYSVFEQFGVRAVLFGSVVRGRSSLRSDIDVLVWSLPAKDFWAFTYALEEATGYPCDVYNEADDPIFVKKIRARGEVVYERER